MSITKITLSNFRKGNLELEDVEAINILRGPNASGKSRVLDAVKFGLTGRVGDLKRTSDIFNACATGDHMEVQLEWKNIVIIRGIKKTSKINKTTGMTEYKLAALDSILDGENKIVSGKDNVQAWIDTELNIDDNVLNISGFESMDTVAKRKYLMELMSKESYTAAEVIEYISTSSISVDGMDPDYRDVFKSALDKLVAEADPENIISTMLEIADRNKKFYNADKKDKQGAANTAMQYKAEIKGNVGRLEKLISKRTDLTEKLNQLRVDWEISLESQRSVSRNRSDIALAEAMLFDLNNTQFEQIIEDIEASIDTVTAEMDLLEKTKQPSRDAIETYEQELNVHLREEQNLFHSISSYSTVNESRKSEVELNTREIAQLTCEKPICPILNVECSQDFRDVVDNRTEEIDILNQMIRATNIESEAVKDKLLKLQALINEDNKSLRVATEEYNNVNKIYLDAKQEYNDLDASRKSLIDALNIRKQDNAVRGGRIEELESQLVKFREFVPTAHTPIDKLESQRNVITIKLNELSDQINDLEQKTATLKLQEKASADYVVSSLNHTAWTVIKDLLGEKGFLGEVIRRQVGPIVKTMNAYLKKFNRSEVFYIDLLTPQGKDTLDFGWVRNGEKISHISLSGAEGMINALAMVCTFQTLNQRPYSVLILDEINILFGDSFVDVLDGVYSAPIDFILVSGALHPDVDVEGFKVYEMDEY